MVKACLADCLKQRKALPKSSAVKSKRVGNEMRRRHILPPKLPTMFYFARRMHLQSVVVVVKHTNFCPMLRIIRVT